MKTREARELGHEIAGLVAAGDLGEAHDRLAPLLARRTPFASLDLIGAAVGAAPSAPVNRFLDQIAAAATMGGWVVIGSALGRQLDRDLPDAFQRCRTWIIAADIWYGADILAERVPGPALLERFEPTLDLLAPWREDENAWIRRTVGVAVHFWAKRSRGADELAGRAQTLLAFLTPMFGEWDMSAVKGVGWGFKTLGRCYPDLATQWLADEITPAERPHRAAMLRKALTYLSDDQRARAIRGTRG
jgi:3-methyladenine DNA glycosylase AlkD